MRTLKLYGSPISGTPVNFRIDNAGLLRHILLAGGFIQNGMTSVSGTLSLQRGTADNISAAQSTDVLAVLLFAARADSTSGVLRIDAVAWMDFTDIRINQGEQLSMVLHAFSGSVATAHCLAVLYFEDLPAT